MSLFRESQRFMSFLSHTLLQTLANWSVSWSAELLEPSITDRKLQQQAPVVHSSGGWRSKIKVDRGSVRGQLLGSWMAPSHCVPHMAEWGKEPSGASIHEGTNPLSFLQSRPHLILVTSQRPHLQNAITSGIRTEHTDLARRRASSPPSL